MDHVLAVDVRISLDLGKRDVVGVEHEQTKVLKYVGENLCKAFLVVLGKRSDPDPVQITPVLSIEFGPETGLFKDEIGTADECQSIDVRRIAFRPMHDGDNEPAEAMELRLFSKKRIDIQKKGKPRGEEVGC